MNDGKNGACAPYDILSKCEVDGVEFFAGDTVCLNPTEATLLRAHNCIGTNQSTNDVTKRRLESSGCGACGVAAVRAVDE